MDVNDPSSGLPADPVWSGVRKRPFGVLVVALIQLISVAFALAGSLTQWALPWEGTFVTYLQDHSWARAGVMGMGVAVLVAVVGMWRMRYWGWALMVSLVGVSLLFDLTTWWRSGSATDLPSYLRLTLDVVCAFYLNTRAVQEAYRTPAEPRPAPVAGTQAAGRVEP